MPVLGLRQRSLFPAIMIVLSERDLHSIVLGRQPAHDWIFCTLLKSYPAVDHGG